MKIENEELKECKEMMDLMKIYDLEEILPDLKEPELIEYCQTLLEKRR